MARDPGSLWLPLPEAGAPDGLTKTQMIYHSTGDRGRARSVRDNWFARGDVVVESTFIVGLGPDDPTLQIMDSTDNADANGSANQRGISVEVVGTGDDPFTDWQVSECVRLGIWAAANHPIQRRVIPSHTESGFGWHVMFGAPGPWTSARGKVCPGNRRIQQLNDTVFPAIFAGQEDDVNPEQDKLIRETRDIVGGLAYLLNPPGGEAEGEILLRLRDLSGLVGALHGRDPEAIAGAIPDDLAEQVAQKLADRLAS